MSSHSFSEFLAQFPPDIMGTMLAKPEFVTGTCTLSDQVMRTGPVSVDRIAIANRSSNVVIVEVRSGGSRVETVRLGGGARDVIGSFESTGDVSIICTTGSGSDASSTQWTIYYS